MMPVYSRLQAPAIVALLLMMTASGPSEALKIHVAPATAPARTGFKMGDPDRPDGTRLTLDSRSLLLDEQRWIPVMGEFHYSRYPENEWREELLKMKAGGVDILATYVFWIHHEEVEGQWDWSGRRSLRRFIEVCGEVGMKAIVRCGPWCHGEVRHGGHPDWLRDRGWRLRSDHPDYLGRVESLYREIAEQVAGLLWKDGGPVIGIQLENEYRGPAQHLLTLKRIARDAGLDVPLYTRTGWPALSRPMPFGEIVPLYGVYAEGFWDRELTPMPGRYWSGFHFSRLRTDASIANEILGRDDVRDAPDVAQYPYLTCEIGGGMMSSYHRRIDVYPDDIDSTTLVKIGSGSTSPGYYMYHGGVNPEGKLTQLNESQSIGGWNDLPVKNYDFQTALGQYGQIRPQYHSLRRLHLFLHDFGIALADMPAFLPQQRPGGKSDVATLRWSVRSDGNAGFVFVNNYQRLLDLPPKQDVQFEVMLPGGAMTFPSPPVPVPSGSRFLWPFNLALGHGIQLDWATAQPVCMMDEENVRTVFFAETEGIPAGFAFSGHAGIAALPGTIAQDADSTLVRGVEAGRGVAIQALSPTGATVRVVLLSEADSLALWKGTWHGRERVFLTQAGMVLDGGALRLSSTNRKQLSVGITPAIGRVAHGQRSVRGKSDGVFQRYTPRKPRKRSYEAVVSERQQAGAARRVPMGRGSRPVAAQPEDADFEAAAIWQITLPANIRMETDPLLRLHYVGDVARILSNNQLVTDDFYNGRVFEIGLRRHAPAILKGDLTVSILPLRRDAPIHLSEEARPEFGGAESIVALERVEIVPRYSVELTAP